MMKKISFLIMLISCAGYSQSNDNVFFEYDEAGNQITRELICLSCDDNGRHMNPDLVSELISEEDMLESEHNNITYYPNPVLEDLYIKWVNSEDTYVVSIDVYSTLGQRVLHTNSFKDDNEAVQLDFSAYPSGIYTVVLIYNNEQVKDLKVIKK